MSRFKTAKLFPIVVVAFLFLSSTAIAQSWDPLPGGGPSARNGHSMAYDSTSGKVLLFGGRNGDTPLGDMWEWDDDGWDGPISTPVAPSARYDAAMAYDSARQVVVLFGGKATSREADTWEWDGEAWTDHGVGGPSSRWQHAMAYHAHQGVVVLFGGIDTGTPANLLNDTWVWNGGTWTQLNPDPRPSPRGYATMAYDDERERIVLFGGHDAEGVCGDTWEFTLEFDGVVWTGSWAEITAPDPKPSARDAAAMAYDKTRLETILFGGYGQGYKTGHVGLGWNALAVEGNYRSQRALRPRDGLPRQDLLVRRL